MKKHAVYPITCPRGNFMQAYSGVMRIQFHYNDPETIKKTQVSTELVFVFVKHLSIGVPSPSP